MQTLSTGFPKGPGLLERLTTPLERAARHWARLQWEKDADAFLALRERDAEWQSK